ncbi:MAG: hypothetical protein WD770_03275 [Actinomycetota bacterium]
MDDETLLRRAEEALTEIKVNHGLSEEQASVLAALRIRLKGEAGGSLESMLEAAGDLDSPGPPSHAPGGPNLDDVLAKEGGKTSGSLDDLFSHQPKKPEWPG